MLQIKQGPAWEQEEIREAEIFTCRKCSGLISTGNSEWDHKTIGEKFVYSFKIAAWIASAFVFAFVAAMLGSGGLMLLLDIPENKFSDYYFRSTMISFPIIAFFFVWMTVRNISAEIKDSKARTRKGNSNHSH